MRKILSILALPFLLIGVLLWSAATLAGAAFEGLFRRKAASEVTR